MKDNINNNKKRKKMKKYLMTVVAALAAASFTSCSNEMDMFDPISSEKATIDLNVSNDVLMATRASSEITDYTKWFVKVTPNETGLTNTYNSWMAASSLTSDKTFTPGEYTIAVSNYQDESAVYTTENPYGDAYYTGSATETLKKGPNAVVIDCHQAQNCRVKVDLSGLDNVATIRNASVTLSQTGRGVDCPALTDGQIGYFKAGTPITYRLNYEYKGVSDETWASKSTSPDVSISSTDKHTEYKIVASTNSNGTISLTIKYDSDFEKNNDQPAIIIDAATGEKPTTNP